MRRGVRVDAAQQRRAESLCDLERAQRDVALKAPPAPVERQRGNETEKANGDGGGGGEPVCMVESAFVEVLVGYVLLPLFFR